MSDQTRCPYCDHSGKHGYLTAREMMLGLRERFLYRECAACGSLWIAEIPNDLSRFYQNYYSFASHARNGFRDRLLTIRDSFELGRAGAFGQWLARLRPHPIMRAIGQLRLPRDARIIDIGCGSGWFIDELHAAGWENVLGVDTFATENTRTARGVEIRCTTFDQVDGPFDLIMFHHSLEHMAEPVKVLVDVSKKLSPKGKCLVRIPTTSSEAYELYGEDWVAFDAPRHITIPSRQGIHIAAERASLKVCSITDDSTELQFVGSERYREDTPLLMPSLSKPSTRSAKRALRARVARVNQEGRGDAIAVTMELASSA